jgi:hypothetical protein
MISVMPLLYEYLVPMSKDGWIVLDSSNWSVKQTFQEVLKRID